MLQRLLQGVCCAHPHPEGLIQLRRGSIYTQSSFSNSGTVQNANSENTRARILKCKELPWHTTRARRGWRRGVKEESSSLAWAWAWRRRSVLDTGTGPGGVWPQIPRPGAPSTPTRAFVAQVVACCACLTHSGPRSPRTRLSWAPGHQPARAGSMGSGRGGLHRQPRNSCTLGVCLQAAPLGSVPQGGCLRTQRRPWGGIGTASCAAWWDADLRPGWESVPSPPGARAGPQPSSAPPCWACAPRLCSSPASAWLASAPLRATTRARGSQRPGAGCAVSDPDTPAWHRFQGILRGKAPGAARKRGW